MKKTYALANGDIYNPYEGIEYERLSDNRGVYAIRCEATGTTYVGASGDIATRIIIHKSLLRLGKHYNDALQKDWDFYGESAFAFELIEYVPYRENLVHREQFWIEKVGTANKASAYKGGRPGRRYTQARVDK